MPKAFFGISSVALQLPRVPSRHAPREKHQQNIRTIPYDTVRFRAIPCDTVRYRAIRAHMCMSHCPVGG